MKKIYSIMRKSRLVFLLLATLLVTASVSNRPNYEAPVIAKLSSHEPPAEKLPDYKMLFKLRDSISAELEKTKIRNQAIDTLR